MKWYLKAWVQVRRLLMVGIVPEPNESEAPLTNAQQDEEGSNSEDGNLDSHSEDTIYDIEEFAADVLLDEPSDNSYIELKTCNFLFRNLSHEGLL
ncbi:uncharacterized protein A4U43_C08F15450 [Asparagus officinalis]|nr:uncharacterized protein A4U43_C08F15450 [Asparagus officinalis]